MFRNEQKQGLLANESDEDVEELTTDAEDTTSNVPSDHSLLLNETDDDILYTTEAKDSATNVLSDQSDSLHHVRSSVDPQYECRLILLGGDETAKQDARDFILRTEETRESTERMYKNSVKGRQVSVVCTPSHWMRRLASSFFFSRCLRTIQNDLQDCVSQLFPGPHAFLLVIEPKRKTGKERYLLKAIISLFGEEALDYTIVLFIDGSGQNSVLTAMKNSNVRKCGRYHFLENTDHSVQELFSKVEQMVDRKQSKFFIPLHYEKFMKLHFESWEKHQRDQERKLAQVTKHLNNEHKLLKEVDYSQLREIELSEELDSLRRNEWKLKKEVEDSQQREHELSNELRALKDNEEKLKKEVEETLRRERELRNELDASRSNERKLKQEVEDSTLRECELKNDLDGLRRNEEKLKKEEDSQLKENELRNELDASRVNEVKLKEEVEESHQRENELRSELNASKSNEGKLKKEVEESHRREHELRKELKMSKDNDNKLQKELDAFKDKESKIKKELDVSKGTEKKLRKHLDDLRMKESELRKELNTYRSQENKLRKELDALRNKNPDS